jgi:hypothetical protein
MSEKRKKSHIILETIQALIQTTAKAWAITAWPVRRPIQVGQFKKKKSDPFKVMARKMAKVGVLRVTYFG